MDRAPPSRTRRLDSSGRHLSAIRNEPIRDRPPASTRVRRLCCSCWFGRPSPGLVPRPNGRGRSTIPGRRVQESSATPPESTRAAQRRCSIASHSSTPRHRIYVIQMGSIPRALAQLVGTLVAVQMHVAAAPSSTIIVERGPELASAASHQSPLSSSGGGSAGFRRRVPSKRNRNTPSTVTPP